MSSELLLLQAVISISTWMVDLSSRNQQVSVPMAPVIVAPTSPVAITPVIEKVVVVKKKKTRQWYDYSPEEYRAEYRAKGIITPDEKIYRWSEL